MASLGQWIGAGFAALPAAQKARQDQLNAEMDRAYKQALMDQMIKDYQIKMAQEGRSAEEFKALANKRAFESAGYQPGGVYARKAEADVLGQENEAKKTGYEVKALQAADAAGLPQKEIAGKIAELDASTKILSAKQQYYTAHPEEMNASIKADLMKQSVENDYKKGQLQAEMARIALGRQELGVSQGRLALEKAKFADEKNDPIKAFNKERAQLERQALTGDVAAAAKLRNFASLDRPVDYSTESVLNKTLISKFGEGEAANIIANQKKWEKTHGVRAQANPEGIAAKSRLDTLTRMKAKRSDIENTMASEFGPDWMMKIGSVKDIPPSPLEMALGRDKLMEEADALGATAPSFLDSSIGQPVSRVVTAASTKAAEERGRQAEAAKKAEERRLMMQWIQNGGR